MVTQLVSRELDLNPGSWDLQRPRENGFSTMAETLVMMSGKGCGAAALPSFGAISSHNSARTGCKACWEFLAASNCPS